MAFMYQGKELSPCIVSKMKHALGLKLERPINKKRCCKQYWEQAAKAVGNQHGVANDTIAAAARSYANYISSGSNDKSPRTAVSSPA